MATRTITYDLLKALPWESLVTIAVRWPTALSRPVGRRALQNPDSNQFAELAGFGFERDQVGEIDGQIALHRFNAGNADEYGCGALLVAGKAIPLVGGGCVRRVK